jgi:hypothetical protein
MLDWMARHSTIGGIYGRPIVVGNLLHFASAAIAFAKALMRAPEARVLWPLGVLYAVLALGFAVVLFRSPVREGSAPVPGARPPSRPSPRGSPPP